MKKKHIKKLSLNKIAVSRLNNQHLIKGGSRDSALCTPIKTGSKDRACGTVGEGCDSAICA